MANGNNTTTTTTTEIKWFGDEVLFTTAGGKSIKLWHIIVGLILLSMLLPFFRKRNNK
tara:strand:+ start:736 stop:909 length:174 start_codon:yes stop_codon:yes gene_type:complete